MLIYCVQLVFVLFSCLKRSKILDYSVLLLLMIVLAFRDSSVGTDTINYLNMLYSWNYEVEIAMDSSGKQMEYIWTNFVDLVYKLGLSSDYLVIIPGLVNIFLIYYSFRRFKINVNVALLFFVIMTYYFLAFNILRQTLAVSITLLAYSFAIEKNYYKYFIAMFFAVGVHFSSAICLPIILLNWLNSNLKLYIPLLIISLVLGLSGLDLYFLKSYSFYDSYSDLVSAEAGVTSIRVFIRIFMTLFSIYAIKQKRVDNVFIVNLFVLANIIDNMCLRVDPIIYRISFYFSIIYPVFLSKYFESYKIKLQANVIFYLFVLVYFVNFMYSLILNSGEIVPYSFNKSFF